MYKVVNSFADMKDSNHVYLTGDSFPRKGVTAKQERLKELLGKGLIEKAKEEKLIEKAEEVAEKAEISPEKEEKPAKKESTKKTKKPAQKRKRRSN